MTDTSKSWIQEYSDDYSGYAAAADLAVELVKDAYATLPLAINSISGRAKDPQSVVEKITRKGYSHPREQMTDLIGVRVTTTYAHGVDQAADRLESLFRVIEREDKRGHLTLHEFGYRSVHLVLRIDKSRRLGEAAQLLEVLPVEVQIRSVLEHAWAEIEHDLRYKGGSSLDDALNRRFSAVAGALEVLDREFDRLHVELYSLVSGYSKYYASTVELTPASIDGPRLMGVLSARRPLAERMGPEGTLMALPAAARGVSLLQECGLTDDAALLQALAEPDLLKAIREYAYAAAVDPDRVSGTAVIQLLAGVVSHSTGVTVQYSLDPHVIAAVESALAGD